MLNKPPGSFWKSASQRVSEVSSAFSELPHVPPHLLTAREIGRHKKYWPIATNLAEPVITPFILGTRHTTSDISFVLSVAISDGFNASVLLGFSPLDLIFFVACYESATKILISLNRIDTNLDLSYPTNSISLPTFRLTTSRNLSRSFPIIIF